MELNGTVMERQVAIAFFLGIASLVAICISMLALNDIYRGESDLRAEWTALRIVFALATFWSMIRREISNA